MLEPWNDPSVLPPPVHTTLCHNNLVVSDLRHACNNIIRVLSKQSPLHREGAIFSRFMYKFDKKFRNDIGFRNFKKVNTALRRYLVINLLKDIENFESVLPGNDDEPYLPTRQMLEYILIRIMAFSKLMLRICVCSKQAAIFYLDRVKRGESHWMSLMPYAILSRVWSMSLVLLQHSCSWYSNLFTFLDKLTHKGLDFLPVGYKLPLDFEEWLDLKNLENLGKFNWSQKKHIEFDAGLVEDNEGDRFENILEYVSQINCNDISEENMEMQSSLREPICKKELKVNEELKPFRSNDQGVAISRDIFKHLLKNTDPVSINRHSIEGVTNKDSLQQFIGTEEKLRNESSDQSLTSHLSFMQWQALKNSIQKLLDSLANNRKIQRKFQKIWKEKCIDCT